MHFAKCGRYQFNIGKFIYHPFNHIEKNVGVQFGFRGNFGARNTKTGLKILFVSNQHLNIPGNIP